MCVIEMKVFLILSILWGCGRGELVRPRLLLANGTAIRNGDIIYIVFGKPLELYCTGQEGYELQMAAKKLPEDAPRHELVTSLVNETTTLFFNERPEKGNLIYECKYKESLHALQNDDFATIYVVVGTPPAVENFRCISMNLEYLNCSWTSTAFTKERLLYYVKDGVLTIICKTHYLNEYCIWDSKNPVLNYQEDAANLTFFMKTCSSFGCTNQTFEFEHRAILKFSAPELKVASESSYGVILQWKVNLVNYVFILSGFYILEQKISYRYSRYSGIPQYQAINISSEKINEMHGLGRIELKLPCANEFYEARVSVRPRLADGEGFWSDDAVVTFQTDAAPEGAEAAVDPTCNQPRADITPDVMLYLIGQFMDKTKREQNDLKTKINSMRLKVGRVNN